LGGSGDPPNVLANRSLWSQTSRATFDPTDTDLPASPDVAIIGAGYTGLAAARALARRGASVLVVDRGALGAGASGLNAGFVLPGYKADLLVLHHRLGAERSRALFRASLEAIEFVEDLIREEAIDCHWHRPGSLVLAAQPRHMAALAQEQRLLAKEYGHPTTLLSREELSAELGSGAYHGALFDPAAGALHPMEYLVGLGRAAQRAGARIRTGVEVRRIRQAGSRFALDTSRGVVEVRQVVVATNGYTGALVPWLARRIVPVGSYLLATAPLDPALLDRLLPHRRVMSDTRNLLYYFRVSPDGRLLFGGRAAFRAESLGRSTGMLREGMTKLFPELGSVAIDYAWGGTLGFTRDHLPHVGLHEGIAYAVGYGGHGVALASALGDQLGRAMVGQAEWPLLAQLGFPAIPLYRGRPWFLPLAGAYYGLRDRIGL
jgi:glycine/D-amino acid oxidase-like deaminating enzyme